LRADYTFDGGITATSITAGRRSEGDNQIDLDFGPSDARFARQPTQYQQFSQEFRLASAAEQRLTWLLGAFYFHDRLTGVTNIHTGPDFLIAPPRTLGELFAAGESAVDSFDTYNRQWPSVDSKAVFGSATYDVTDALSVTAGLRYTTEDLRLAVASDSTPAGFASRPFERFAKTEDNLSPSVSVNYKFTPDVMAYGTVSQGWQSGGFNTAPTIVIGGREFKQEKATNYELGVKSTLSEGRVVANAAVFYMDYTDLQRGQFFLVGSNLVQTTTNAAEASVQGVEVELTARAAQSLDLSLRLGYQDAKYDRYPNAPVQTDTGGSALVDLTGEPLPMAPKYTAALGAQYVHPITTSTDLLFGLQYEYRDEYLLANNPPDLFHEDAVDQLELNVGVAASDERWSVMLRGRNVTGDVYKTNVFIVDGSQWMTLSDPETVELEFAARF
jgi:iron complex outermembrane receptor protein